MARKLSKQTPAVSTPRAPSIGPAPEVVAVHSHRIACDGVGGALGHPRVFLEMGDEPYVECPYCDRRFVMAKGKGPTGAPGVYEDAGGH
jgi:uncharacterized Zn-finger protein